MAATPGRCFPKLLKTLAPALLTLTFCATAGAQDRTAEIDKLFSWATSATPGCVCAVSQNGKVVANRAYGLADLERNVPLDTNSVFDIASVQKQFVAAATLLLVEAQRLSLTDDIRKYIPELPDYGHRITIDHLLTHTSGLRDWDGIEPLSAKSANALAIILRQRGLNFTPGEEWAYSNSGYVLLKELIARTSGMPFSEFARRRLFEPLGMKRTTYQDDLRAVVPGRALAYGKQGGRWRLAVALDNDRGGGGALLSTAADLLLWNDALSEGRLGAFVTQKLQEPARLNNGRKLGYARGLYLDSTRGGNIVWHTGGSAGYGTLLTRFPDQRISIAILCNQDETDSKFGFARRIFSLLAPPAAVSASSEKAPGPAIDSAGAAATDLTGKAGLFLNERTGEPLRLAVNNGKLAIAGGPALVTVAKDRFRNPAGTRSFMSNDEFELHFRSPDGFALKTMEGRITNYRRSAPYAPTEAELKSLGGRYDSPEIGSVLMVEPKGKNLLVRFEHLPDNKLEFKPIYRDTFQWSRMTIRFVRDKAGKVVALDYSNPVIRNIRFRQLQGNNTHP